MLCILNWTTVGQKTVEMSLESAAGQQYAFETFSITICKLLHSLLANLALASPYQICGKK